MGLIESRTNPDVSAEVDRSYASLRSSLRPIEFATQEHMGGHYRGAWSTGLVTIVAAGGALFSARLTDPQRQVVLNTIKASAVVSTAFGTAQEVSLNLVRTTNAVAADTGGTAITMGESGRKSRTMRPAVLTDLRIATTAALGAGAGVVEESENQGILVLPIGNAVGNSASGVLYDNRAGEEHPFILNALEGFRIRVHFTQGAAGVIRFTFTVDWTEVPLKF